jgi:serine/threonine protein kinase
MQILPRELQQKFQVIGEPLGEGGMGAVYKARHVDLNRVCVIKVMQGRLQNDTRARNRFLEEAKRGAESIHPNIAVVLDYFVGANGTGCIVMEYIDGENLRDLLSRSGSVEWQLVIDIGIQALSALACLHSRNIVHRDISPDNLMLTNGPGKRVVKLIDLGLTKVLEDAQAAAGTFFFMGKPSFAPPEQFGGLIDARSDIYSLGVVLYQLLTGQLPIRAPDMAGFNAAHGDGVLPRPFAESDPRGRVPEAVRRVVLRALEKDPAKRFQTAQQFADALEHAQASSVATVPELSRTRPIETSQPLPPRANRPHWFRTGVIAALTTAVIIGAVVVRMRQSSVPIIPPQRDPKIMTTAGTVVNVVPPTEPVPSTSGIETPVTKSSAAEVTEGMRLSAGGDIAAAYAAFARAAERDPSNAYAWSNLGGAAAKLGKLDEARHSYDRALAIDPQNWLAHYNLGCLFARNGNREEAFSEVARAVGQLRQQARSKAELESYIRNIRTDDALRTLRTDSRFEALLLASN